MKSLKINKLEKENLSRKQMSNIVGGRICRCGCKYANDGGSSTNGNGMANVKIGEVGGFSVGVCWDDQARFDENGAIPA